MDETSIKLGKVVDSWGHWQAGVHVVELKADGSVCTHWLPIVKKENDPSVTELLPITGGNKGSANLSPLFPILFDGETEEEKG